MKRLPALFAAIGLAAVVLAALAGPEGAGPPAATAGGAAVRRREIAAWPGGVVAYRFDAGVEPGSRELILDAMREWERATGAVSFVEVPAPTFPWAARVLGRDRSLLVREDPRLASFARTTVGAGPLRSLVFNPAMDESAWRRSDFLHELGHILGLTHEHQRPDRDLYVRIPEEFWDRAGSRASDYSVDDGGPFAPGTFPYDYASIMHYGSNIDRNMMTRLDTGGLVASAKSLSPLDIAKVRRLYGR